MVVKRIYKRVGENDIDNTGRDNLIADLYLNKKDVSSETNICQLFGKDDTIGSVLPHYRTDLIMRRTNLDRYDESDTLCTNLIR